MESPQKGGKHGRVKTTHGYHSSVERAFQNLLQIENQTIIKEVASF